MKKTILHLILLTSISTIFAQTFVSTLPQNKKVVLEEFTGVNCVFCPQGHAAANVLKNANPDSVFLINIHEGGYSNPSAGQPDFRTPFGTAIAGQSGLLGYPAGTVNRQVFSFAETAGTTALGRNQWAAAVNQVLAQNSYVNVAATSSINAASRILTVNVEAYYTGTSPVPTNKLNVALLQNNTLGFQTGGNMGNDYVHQHRLIHMVTGQWGDDITTTTTGTFVSRTYTYTIPANYNLIPATIGDFEIVAFVADGTQKIQSGAASTPTYTGLIANEIQFKKLEPIYAQCAATGTLTPKIVIRNNGQNTLTSLAINYAVNSGTSQTYNWTGSLSSFQDQTVTLAPIAYAIQASNTINLSIPPDDLNTNNTATTSFAKAVDTQFSNITIKITLDAYGGETSWKLTNSAGTIVAQNPIYTSAPNGSDTSATYPQADINLNLPLDCYNFIVSDSFGDGMTPGNYKVFANGVQIPGISGSVFTSTSAKAFGVIQNLSTSDFSINKLAIYPNPSNGYLKIQTELPVDLILIDVLGKVVFTAKNISGQSELDLTSLQKGFYLAKITGENINYSEKLILK